MYPTPTSRRPEVPLQVRCSFDVRPSYRVNPDPSLDSRGRVGRYSIPLSRERLKEISWIRLSSLSSVCSLIESYVIVTVRK